MSPFHPHTVSTFGGLHRLCCNRCGEAVSTGFLPVPTDTPDRGLVVRAFIECPECLEKEMQAQTASAKPGPTS